MSRFHLPCLVFRLLVLDPIGSEMEKRHQLRRPWVIHYKPIDDLHRVMRWTTDWAALDIYLVLLLQLCNFQVEENVVQSRRLPPRPSKVAFRNTTFHQAWQLLNDRPRLPNLCRNPLHPKTN